MEETTVQPQNEVAMIITNSIPVLQTAPEVLKANEEIKTKALMVGQKILDAANDGLTAEWDERAMKYLANIDIGYEKMKNDRSSITQIMDALKKMYTTIESEINRKDEKTIPGKVQAFRNKYAKQVAEEREAKRREEELAANKKKEEIEVVGQVEISFTKFFGDFLLSRKQKLQEKFNALVLDSFADDAAAIRQYQPTFSPDYLKAFAYTVTPRYITAERRNELVQCALPALIEKAGAKYVSEMTALKQEIVDKLPSKHEELKEERRLLIERQEAEQRAKEEEAKRQAEIAKANAEEKKRLEEESRIRREAEEKRLAELKAEEERLAAEKSRREQEEKDRLAKEAEEAQKKAELDAELKMQGEQTMVMFEKEAALATTDEMPEARQGYEIIVLHPVGYTQIMALWFERVGKDLPIDKLGNTKLDQMKAWAEKEAHKTGEKINSTFLKYEETFKAVNRKKP